MTACYAAPMNMVTDIEAEFAKLSAASQLELLERLLHRARVGQSAGESGWERQLVQMAEDPRMRNELANLSSEFAAAEEDGLEKRLA